MYTISLKSMAQVAAVATLTCGLAARAEAQSLNWDGQTGGVVTPFATVVESPKGGLGHPFVSFDFLSGGDVIGNRFQVAITIGFGGRVEIGYVKSVGGETEGLSRLFDRGFQNVHGKVQLTADNRRSGMPAIAVGGRFAWQLNSLTEAAPLRTGDVYLVVSKSIAATERVDVQLNGGVKATNAALLSLGGNASKWSARAFGAAAVDFHDQITIGAEVLQQPQEIEGLEEAAIPPTFTVFVRVIPMQGRVSIVAAFVRLAGEVAPGVDIRASSRFALGATVRFW